jgi:hypothetical protein
MNDTKEFIACDPLDGEAWICICGNRQDSEGFFPCDKEGNEMAPTLVWRDLYVCDRCGRIIDQHSLEVMGRNPNFRRL